MPYKNKEDEKIYRRKYYIEHREQLLQQWKNYYIEHREQRKNYYLKNETMVDREKRLESCRKWYINNKKNKSQYQKQYNENHQEQKSKYNKQYYENNREKAIEQKKQWNKDNPEKTKEIYARHKNKRERNLGFNPLNIFFKGSVAHHINKNDVIYIPKDIHKNISHCLETGRNMEKINMLAFNFMNKGGE